MNLTRLQQTALEVAIEALGRDEKGGPVALGAIRVLQEMLAAPAPSASKVDRRQFFAEVNAWTDDDWREVFACFPEIEARFRAVLASPSASPSALTDSARRLMLAADDVDMGRSIHNQRKPDDKIEGAVWDELRRASAAVRALLVASSAALTERALIDAANARADLYEGDDRPCIKTDVMNAFYAGAEFAMRASPAALTDEQIFALWDQVHTENRLGPREGNNYRRQICAFARALLAASPARNLK